LTFTQHGVLTPSRRELRLDAMNLGLQAGNKPILEAHLDQPMTWRRPRRRRRSDSNGPDQIERQRSDGGVAQALAGAGRGVGKARAPAGSLSGQATLTVADAGRRLTLEGAFAGLGLVDAAGAIAARRPQSLARSA